MKTFPLAILTLLILLPVAATQAQKQGDNEPVGIFQSRSEYHEFMGNAKRIAYGPEGNLELQAMIPMLNDIALNQPIGSTAGQYDVQGSTLGLLSDEKIRGELEMMDDQYDDLKRLNSEIQDRVAEQIRGLDFKDAGNLAEQIRGIREQARNDLHSVLLPHQLTRLRQIRMQSQLRRRSLVDLITSDPLKTELEVSDRQTRELRETEEEIEKELEEEIAKLRAKARDRLLSKLKPGQKDKVEEMFGDAFDFGDSPNDKRSEAKIKRRSKKGK